MFHQASAMKAFFIMLTKRIIPCLDIKDGRTVKGTNFIDLRDAGDPVELGALYAQEGADELVFLDITATVEKRKTLSELVHRIAKRRELNRLIREIREFESDPMGVATCQ